MKKFYFFLVMLFAGITAATAEDYTMTITVDDASHVNVSYGIYDPDTGAYTKYFVEAVDNVFTVTAPMYTSVNVNAATGYQFTSILNADGSEQLSSYNRFEYSAYIWSDGMSYTISTAALEYAGKVTVQCDDPSAVDILTSLRRTLTLEDTSEPQELWLLAEELCEDESQPVTSFMSKSSGKPFYSFKQNGDEIAGSNGYYYANLAADDQIVIQTIFPEIPCTVTINVDGADVADVLTIEVDDEPITATSVFQVSAGSKLALIANTDYTYSDFTVNGVSGWFTTSWSDYILADTEIAFTATEKPRYDVTIDIDTPENVKFYIGQPYDENLTTLQPGENAFNVVKGTYLFLQTADSNSTIDGVYLNGSEDNSSWSSLSWSYAINDNLSVRVVTSHFERENSFIYYLDADPETTGAQFDGSQYEPEVQRGYNVIYFNPEHDGPFAVYWQWDGGPARYVYRNGEKFEPASQWETSIVWDPMNQDDVVKVFAEEPTTYTVNLAGNATIGSDYSAVVDRVTNITSADEPLTVFSGTELTLANTNETETLTIDVDGEAADYEPGEDTTIIFDGTETTCNITVSLPEPIAVPENLYIFGEIDDIGWNPGSSAAFDKADNVFTYYGEITGGGYFGISEVQSTVWDDVNAARWSGAQGADQAINLDEATELQRGKDASMKLPAGAYKFEVTFTDALVTLTVSEWSGVELINAADAAADAEYYTLQGVRVAAPAAGGVYVVRRGAEVSKQYIR